MNVEITFEVTCLSLILTDRLQIALSGANSCRIIVIGLNHRIGERSKTTDLRRLRRNVLLERFDASLEALRAGRIRTCRLFACISLSKLKESANNDFRPLFDHLLPPILTCLLRSRQRLAVVEPFLSLSNLHIVRLRRERRLETFSTRSCAALKEIHLLRQRVERVAHLLRGEVL